MGALGRSFYKGGFEPKMTRKEAALILEMPYVYTRRIADFVLYGILTDG
jgi:hypothetical protein